MIPEHTALPHDAPSARTRRIEYARQALLIVTVWIGVGLFTTQFTYLALRHNGVNARWMDLFVHNLFSVLLWAAFTPAIIWLAWRQTRRPAPRLRQGVVHAIACVAFAAADALIERGASLVLPFGELPGTDLTTLFLRRLFLNTLCYIAVAAIASVVAYARISRERDAAAARLAKQLAEARLQSLQAQLRPHFLFNTLSMIAEQVHRDPDGADRMIGRLSQLLRVSLSLSERHEVTFAEELSSLNAYLDIMDVRLSGRVHVELDIADDIGQALVPVLILQPLVENAFRHGVEPRGHGATLRVQARRAGDSLDIAVIDNGTGVHDENVREGVGLRVVRERLAELYGARASFTLRPRHAEQEGTIAQLRIPYRPASEEAATNDHALLETIA